MHLLPLTLLLAGPGRAGPRDAPPEPAVQVWVRAPGEAERAALRELGFGFAEGLRGDEVRVDGPASALAALDRAGLAWRPAEDLAAARIAGEGYHDPEAMVAALEDLADRDADLRLVEVGRSGEGRPLLAACAGAAEPVVRWRIVGAHHGDEPASAELALAVLDELVAARAGEADGDAAEAWSALLDRDAVCVLPHVNPDGIAAGSRYDASGVDLNRNYGYAWSASEYRSGDAPWSEAETRALRAWSTWTGFGAGLSMHAGETNLGWVWNYSLEAVPDDALLEAMAARYADAAEVDGFWITNGAAWYRTWGDLNDWSYGSARVLDFTLEVTDDKAPPPAILEAAIAGHLPGVRAFLTWPDALAVQVVDADSGRGIPATVTLSTEGWPGATAPDGRFGRPADPGPWTISVAAPGYGNTTVTVDTLDAAGGAPETVALTRDGLRFLRPDPALLSQSSGGTFRLPVEAATVVLRRVGEDPVAATPAGDGWKVDPSALAPGPWSLEVDGVVAPRAIFVGERDAAVEVTAVDAGDPGALRLAGHGFGLGSAVWALVGAERAPVPLDVRSEDEALLVVDATPVVPAEGEAPVDLVVVTAGAVVAVLDALSGAPGVDTAEPVDTGEVGGEADVAAPPPRACGCAVPPSGSIPALPLLLLPLIPARRQP